MSKIGMNINGGGAYDEPRLLHYLDRWQPPVCVLMDNSDLALRLQERYPDMTLIWRRLPDADLHKSTDAAAHVRLMASYVPDPRIVLYLINEPPADEAMAAWTLAALDEADRIGRRLCVGNFGYGGPEDAQWEGALLPVLARIGGTQHIMGLHEYWDFHDWRFVGEYKGEPWNVDPLTGNNWMIGRFKRMFGICDRHSIPRPLVAITEHGSDSNRDDKWHGWKAGAGLSEENYAEQTIDIDRLVYQPAPEILGSCLFMWTPSNDKWNDTFGYKDATAFLDAVAAYAEDSRGENRESMELMTVTVTTDVRRREGTGTSARQLPGDFGAGRYTLHASASVMADGYVWRQFDDGGLIWWSATGPVAEPNAWITVEPLPVEPPQEPPTPPEEPPVVEPPTYEDRLLPIMRAWYASLLEWEQTCADLRGMLVETWPELEG